MRNLLLRLTWFSGLTCVIGSACSVWFCVPGSLVQTPGGEWTICADVSGIEPVFKTVLLVASIVAFGLYRFATRFQTYAVVVAAISLSATLHFPYFQSVSQPNLIARANWLHLQHENLTWLGGDLFRNQEHERTPRQLQMYISDSPRQVAVMPLPAWSLDNFSLQQLPSLFDWLGFTNTFCQFAARGWMLAVCGATLITLSTIFVKQRADLVLLRTAILTIFVVSTIGLSAAWSQPILAGRSLSSAALCVHRGQHREAVSHLEHAARIWPPLQEDTQYVVQRGLIDHVRGCDSSFGNFYLAHLLEADGLGARAVDIYRHLADTEPLESPLRREACRGVLRHGERAINSGGWQQALDDLKFVLQHEPCDIKAIYATQVCYMQLSDADGAARMQARLAGVYHFMNFPNKNIVLGKSREMTIKTLLRQENVDEAFQQYSLLWKVAAHTR